MIVAADSSRGRWLIGVVVALLLHGGLLAIAFARFDPNLPAVDAAPIAIDLVAPPNVGTAPIQAAATPSPEASVDQPSAVAATPFAPPPTIEADQAAQAVVLRPAERIADAAPPAAAPPVAPATSADRQAATPSDAAAATRSDAWYALVMARIGRGKRYPPAAIAQHQEDVIALRITVDRAGRLVAAAITASRGYPLLDREALAVVRRAAPFPAPPTEIAGDPIALALSVQFVRKAAR